MRPKATGLRLPVDVFLVGAPDGSLAVLVGNCPIGISPGQLGQILAGEADLGKPRGTRKPAPPRKKPGVCSRCGKPSHGESKLCLKHLRAVRASQALAVKARLAKKAKS